MLMESVLPALIRMIFQLISVDKERPMGITLVYFPSAISELYVTCVVAIHSIPCYVISCYIRGNIKTLDILDNNYIREERGWFGRRDDSSTLSISKRICSLVVQQSCFETPSVADLFQWLISRSRRCGMGWHWLLRFRVEQYCYILVSIWQIYVHSWCR